MNTLLASVTRAEPEGETFTASLAPENEKVLEASTKSTLGACPFGSSCAVVVEAPARDVPESVVVDVVVPLGSGSRVVVEEGDREGCVMNGVAEDARAVEPERDGLAVRDT